MNVEWNKAHAIQWQFQKRWYSNCCNPSIQQTRVEQRRCISGEAYRGSSEVPQFFEIRASSKELEYHEPVRSQSPTEVTKVQLQDAL